MDKSQQKILNRWLQRQSAQAGTWVRLTVTLGSLNGVALVAQAALLAHLLHQLIIEQVPRDALMPAFIGLVLVSAAKALLAWGRERAAFVAGSRVRLRTREQLLDQLHRLGPVYIQGRPAGTWSALVLEQVEKLHDFYARYLPQRMIAGFIPLVILVTVFPFNWASGLILLLTAPLMPLFMALVGMGAADANRRNFLALGRLSGFFLDRLNGLETLKLFHREQAESERLQVASEDFRQRTMEVLRLAFLSSAVLEFFAAISVAIVAVYFGFSYLGHLDFGHYGAGVTLFTGLLVLILAPEFFQPMRELGTYYHARAEALGAAEQLVELLEARVEARTLGQQPFTAAGPVAVEACDLEVLSLDGTALTKPLTFSLPAGSTTALVGPSGAGKSSLVNVLLGYLDYRGSLQVNGQELRQLRRSDWHRAVSWLGQNPLLVHGSIRDNLQLDGQARPAEQLQQLLADAYAAEFVDKRGLDATVGEQGRGLSVGQAQRLALARTLGKPAGLLLLDEPTASLDRRNAQWVSDALRRSWQDKTVLMVTHRMESLQQMDQILVIDQGQLVEQGRFETLQQAGGGLGALLGQGVSLDG